MSGTSLDGIDLIHVSLVRNASFNFHVHKALTIPYTDYWVQKLKNAALLSEIDLKELNTAYTVYLAQVINDFMSTHAIKDILCICSHGHTILHNPAQGYTLQIGNLPQLATMVNQRVVCDFRVADVALGGQGAPLVPIGDALLFSDYTYCLNLGGFANVSFDLNGHRIAYDICPVNVVMNHYARMLGKMFDDDGAFAKAGKVITPVLSTLNALTYYHQSPPKSLGIEWVNLEIWSILDVIPHVEDRIATFLEHIAYQIAQAFTNDGVVLVTGGGAYNSYLIKRVNHHANRTLIVPDSIIIEFKEAIIFSLLGVLRLRNEINCLASVTGAIKNHSSGEIYYP